MKKNIINFIAIIIVLLLGHLFAEATNTASVTIALVLAIKWLFDSFDWYTQRGTHILLILILRVITNY